MLIFYEQRFLDPVTKGCEITFDNMKVEGPPTKEKISELDCAELCNKDHQEEIYINMNRKQ